MHKQNTTDPLLVYSLANEHQCTLLRITPYCQLKFTAQMSRRVHTTNI